MNPISRQAESEALAHRLELLAYNTAGIRRMLASNEAERDRVRGLLRDHMTAWENQLNEVTC